MLRALFFGPPMPERWSSSRACRLARRSVGVLDGPFFSRLCLNWYVGLCVPSPNLARIMILAPTCSSLVGPPIMWQPGKKFKKCLLRAIKTLIFRLRCSSRTVERHRTTLAWESWLGLEFMRLTQLFSGISVLAFVRADCESNRRTQQLQL